VAITDEKYVLLTTFRKNGEAVPTPVWIVALADGTAGFTTEIDSGKVKRIRNNPAVTVQPCTLRGKVVEASPVIPAIADVLTGPAARSVSRAVRRKYQGATALLAVGDLVRAIFRRPSPVECAIRLTFD
jgi:PPOX class probable F420-dependent enzyme